MTAFASNKECYWFWKQSFTLRLIWDRKKKLPIGPIKIQSGLWKSPLWKPKTPVHQKVFREDWVTTAIQLVWLNQLIGTQPSHYSQSCVIKRTCSKYYWVQYRYELARCWSWMMYLIDLSEIWIQWTSWREYFIDIKIYIMWPLSWTLTYL